VARKIKEGRLNNFLPWKLLDQAYLAHNPDLLSLVCGVKAAH